jgi:hypothetical protein
MIIKRKLFARLQPISRGVRNAAFKVNKAIHPKKTVRQLAEGPIKLGRGVDRIVTKPAAVVADGVVNLASKPLETVAVPLIFSPEPVSTVAGLGIAGAGKGLRKIPFVNRASEGIANKMKSSNLYNRAQRSNRGFHNYFGLKPATV